MPGMTGQSSDRVWCREPMVYHRTKVLVGYGLAMATNYGRPSTLLL
jgi:hypothetical protein